MRTEQEIFQIHIERTDVMLKKTTPVILAALLLAAAVSCKKDEDSHKVTAENELTAEFLDVGKADAIILTTSASTVVIDCGEKGDGKEVVKYLEDKEITSVDYLIITHYDKDHVGGASKLIKSLDVKNVLAPDYEAESDEVDKYKKALSEKNIEPKLLTEDISFTLDGVEYTVDAPDKKDYGADNDNDFSLVTKVKHGDNTLLFTGDAMDTRLSEIMDIGHCTLLKVPYHGRKLDKMSEFLDAVSPECAVVCTSQDEFSGAVQKLLKKNNITYYATCFNGNISAVSDGSKITVTAEKGS